MATQEEIKNAISEGLEEFTETLAKRYLSGAKLNFRIDDEGNVIVGGDSVELPEDDPETGFDENLGARAGGAKAVAAGLQEIVNNMFNWYAASATIPQASAQTRLQLLYGFDATAAADFAAYWYVTYQNTQGTITFPGDTLAGKFFCKGINSASFSEYIYENHSVALEVPVLEKLAQALPQATLDSWFAAGSKVPSSAYQVFPCTKIKTESFQLDMSTNNTPQYTTSGVWKAGHRYLVEITGSFTDSDNANLIGDGVWFHDTGTGTKTFIPPTFNFSGSVSGITSAQVPFESNHNYAFTVEKNAGSGDAAGIISRDNGSMALPNTTGILSFTITDLGEFAL